MNSGTAYFGGSPGAPLIRVSIASARIQAQNIQMGEILPSSAEQRGGVRGVGEEAEFPEADPRGLGGDLEARHDAEFGILRRRRPDYRRAPRP